MRTNIELIEKDIDDLNTMINTLTSLNILKIFNDTNNSNFTPLCLMLMDIKDKIINMKREIFYPFFGKEVIKEKKNIEENE